MSTTEQRGRDRRRRRREGAAYVESIIVVPALILVFSLVLFVKDGYTQALGSAEQVRGQAWSNTMGSCTSDTVPSPTRLTEGSNWDGAGLVSALALEAQIASRLIGKQPLVVSPVTALQIGSFWIKRRDFAQDQSLRRPLAIGGNARYGHQLYMTCDENLDDLEMPGVSFGVWNFSAWNEAAWRKADL